MRCLQKKILKLLDFLCVWQFFTYLSYGHLQKYLQIPFVYDFNSFRFWSYTKKHWNHPDKRWLPFSLLASSCIPKKKDRQLIAEIYPHSQLQLWKWNVTTGTSFFLFCSSPVFLMETISSTHKNIRIYAISGLMWLYHESVKNQVNKYLLTHITW